MWCPPWICRAKRGLIQNHALAKSLTKKGPLGMGFPPPGNNHISPQPLAFLSRWFSGFLKVGYVIVPQRASTNNDYTRWFSRRDPTWSPNIGGHDSNLWVWGHVSTIRTKNCQAKGLLFAKKIDGTDPTQHNLNKSWSDFLVSPAVFFLITWISITFMTIQLETSSRWLNHPFEKNAEVKLDHFR